MDREEQNRLILAELARLYPDARPALHFANPFELLVAVMLSAQCTDVKVNMVTPALFAAYPDAAALAKAEPAEIEPIIKTCGLFHNKAKNLVLMARELVARFGGEVPAHGELTDDEKPLIERVRALPALVEKYMDLMQPSNALTEIWKLVSDCNKYIDVTQPWVLGRSEEGKPRLSTVMYTLAECVRIIAVYTAPFMPRTPERIFEQLGVTEPELKTWESVAEFGAFKPGTHGAELVPEMKVVSDHIFTKSKSNALTSEEFAAFIKENGITEFYIAGADAAACIKSTCFNMTKSGYTVHVLSDCITSYDKKKLPELLTYYESKGCEVLALSEVVQA